MLEVVNVENLYINMTVVHLVFSHLLYFLSPPLPCVQQLKNRLSVVVCELELQPTETGGWRRGNVKKLENKRCAF